MDKKTPDMKFPPLSAEKFDAMTDEQKAEYKFKQMGQTLGASPSKPAPKAKKKPVKKMMGGGMAKTYSKGSKVQSVPVSICVGSYCQVPEEEGW